MGGVTIAPLGPVEGERRARAWLASVAEPGDERLSTFVEERGPSAAVEAIANGQRPFGERTAWRARAETVDIDDLMHKQFEAGGRLVIPGDAEWPTQLNDLGSTTPMILWVRGPLNLRVAAVRSVSIVGARAASTYGVHVASTISTDLAQDDWAVVSGGAYGIDAAAHRGALAVGGATVAVLACGVDVAYPRGHESLLERIAAEGLLVSELPPQAHPTRSRFLVRNRVIAALTRGTIVVEAALRSGSLSTARQALELSRQVMGVPGPVTSPSSAGVHQLLRSPETTLVTDASDVADCCGLIGDDAAPWRSGRVRQRDELSGPAATVLESMPARGSMTTQVLIRESGLDDASVLTALGQLNLLGYVSSADGEWALVPR